MIHSIRNLHIGWLHSMSLQGPCTKCLLTCTHRCWAPLEGVVSGYQLVLGAEVQSEGDPDTLWVSNSQAGAWHTVTHTRGAWSCPAALT
jgi:hypothetical protein